MENKLSFRPAVPGDEGKILYFINALADYEKAEPGSVEATEELLRDQLFEKERAHVYFICENEKEVGFFMYFFNFSTWVDRSGFYLEDLFIEPEYRKKGYGKAAFRKMAEIALENGCKRMDWVCLNWNQPSIDFYEGIGAVAQREWILFRASGDAIGKIAGK